MKSLIQKLHTVLQIFNSSEENSENTKKLFQKLTFYSYNKENISIVVSKNTY